MVKIAGQSFQLCLGANPEVSPMDAARALRTGVQQLEAACKTAMEQYGRGAESHALQAVIQKLNAVSVPDDATVAQAEIIRILKAVPAEKPSAKPLRYGLC
jgi:hypothetical protein